MIIVAWVGIIIMAIGVVISFNISWELAHPGPPDPYPTMGVGANIGYVMLLDIVGLIAILTGGLIARPSYFWLASILIGILYTASFLVHEIGLLGKSRINREWFFFLLVPGLIMIVEGISLGLIDFMAKRRLQSPDN